jgi:hypothetical protein
LRHFGKHLLWLLLVRSRPGIALTAWSCLGQVLKMQLLRDDFGGCEELSATTGTSTRRLG